MTSLKTIQTISKTLLLFWLLTITSIIHAEIVFDGSLGTKGTLQGIETTDKTVFYVMDFFGKQEGSNLFHSFEKFNIDSKEAAVFLGPNSINNIISRVTGGQASYINGLLQSSIPNADMYFINPAGIIFGPNAILNVPGSFHASTADYLRLGKDGLFNATHPERSVLKIAPPSAFGFLNESPSGISKQESFLRVPIGKTLSFIGGDLTIQDNLLSLTFGEKNIVSANSSMIAPDGQINLVSIASPGEIPVNPKNIQDSSFQKFGNINILDNTAIENNQYRSSSNGNLGNINVSGAGGGSVYIRGGKIVVDNGYIWADARSNQNGQGIIVKASEELVLTNGAKIAAQVVRNPHSQTTGKAGDIDITAKHITINNGAMIDNSTQLYTAGDAGEVVVSAKESIEISGFLSMPINGKVNDIKSGIYSQNYGEGAGGQVIVSTPNLIMKDNAVIRADTQNLGKAGNISVKVDTLSLAGGAQIKSSSGEWGIQYETGEGGKLNIEANKAIFISGDGYIRDKIQPTKIVRQPSGLLSNAFTQGEGGAIEISAPTLEIGNQGTIQSAAAGKGNAGQIFIKAGEMVLSNKAAITTQSIESAGGDIMISPGNRLYLVNSEITTKATGGETLDKGGNITIDNPLFSILDDSKLTTTGFQGDGGNIRIVAEHFIKSSDSVLDASSEFGIDGEIFIDSTMEDFTKIELLSSKLINKFILPLDCKFYLSERISTLREITREGLLASPDELQH